MFCGNLCHCPLCSQAYAQAACLVSGARRYDHITPVLQELMASGSTSVEIQDGHPVLPVNVRHGSSLSGRRLLVGLRRRSSSAAFCHSKDVRCETKLQQLWRQMFHSCRSEVVEQPSSWSVTSWHWLLTIQMATKEIVRVLRSQRIATNC